MVFELKAALLSLLLGEATELGSLVVHHDDVLSGVGLPLGLRAQDVGSHPVHQRLTDTPVTGLHNEVFLSVHHHRRHGIAVAVDVCCQEQLHGLVHLHVDARHALDALVGGSRVVVVESLQDVQETAPRIWIGRNDDAPGVEAIVDGHGVVAAQFLLVGIYGHFQIVDSIVHAVLKQVDFTEHHTRTGQERVLQLFLRLGDFQRLVCIVDGAVELALVIEGSGGQRIGCTELLHAVLRVLVSEFHRCLGVLSDVLSHGVLPDRFDLNALCIHLECHSAYQRHDCYDSFHIRFFLL